MDQTKMESSDEFATFYVESDLSKGLVAWDGQEDAQNPRNFSSARKWTALILLSGMIVLSYLTSTILTPAASTIVSEFHVDLPILSSLVTTIYIFGFLFGPLILSPLSELYGRRPILNSANAFFTLCHIGCALAPNVGTFLAFRILSGIGGSVSLAVGSGIVADLFDIHQRGIPNALVTTGSLFGPVLGPILGGVIAQNIDWRWIFWTLLIASAIITIAMAMFTPETNAVVIIHRKLRKLRREMDKPDLQNAYDTMKKPSASKSSSSLLHAVLRPWKMMIHSPILVILCLIVGLLSGLLYILLTTTSTFFQDMYGWSLEAAGLAYLGLGFGSLVGLILFAKTSDMVTVRLTKANENVFEPEMQMVTAFLPLVFIPVSFFWYGWATYARTHWIVPLIGLVPFGFAQVGINVTVQAYLIDASGSYAASSMACVTAVRCLFGAFFPLIGPNLYGKLGLGWGNTLLGLISLVMVPLTCTVYKFGQKLRQRYPLNQG